MTLTLPVNTNDVDTSFGGSEWAFSFHFQLMVVLLCARR